jgi:hypothetical protein
MSGKKAHLDDVYKFLVKTYGKSLEQKIKRKPKQELKKLDKIEEEEKIEGLQPLEYNLPSNYNNMKLLRFNGAIKRGRIQLKAKVEIKSKQKKIIIYGDTEEQQQLTLASIKCW